MEFEPFNSSFNKLFSEVINPKLQKLTRSVTGFTGITCEISKFITSLEGVYGYLANYNPADELLKLIGTFNGNSYVDPIKSHIQLLLDEINNQDVECKYDQIIAHLHSLARPYNQLLKSKFENFKTKIEGHKESLEENIKQYIEKIREDLNEHSCCVQDLINKICDNVKSLSENHSKLGQFTYDKNNIIKHSIKFEHPADTTHFEKIVNTHEKYKKCLESCYSKITYKLNKFICDLKCYKGFIILNRNSLSKYKDSVTDCIKIKKGINSLQIIKSLYLDKFNKHMKCVQKLEEIGKYIKTMKSELESVEDKVLPQVESYIEGLKDIDIKANEVEKEIREINIFNNIIIGKLQIAKHTIKFFNTLKGEIKKFNDVEFNDYDFTVYWTVLGKLESFESTIKSKLCNAKKEIEKNKEENKQQIEEATKNGDECEGKTQVEQDGNDAISKVLGCLESSLKHIPNIKKSIEDSLKEIEMIKHILSVIQDIKNDSPDISDIKCKVSEITKLKDATTNLTGAREKLKKFVKLQERTKSLIDTFKLYPKFTGLDQFSNPLEDSIGLSYALIGNIELSIKLLNSVTKVDYLIRWINSCYSSRFDTIKGIIQNFKGNVKEIIGRLETINKNLCLIKTLSYQKKVENNLWRLKEYMTYLKVYINNIRRDFDVVTGVIDQIKKDSSYIDRYKRELESLEKYIHCYINHINCNKNNNVLRESVVKHLGEIKDKIKEILIVIKYIKDFHSHPKCINKIQDKLKDVESNVGELECEIQGVGRNFLFESGMIRMNTTSMVVTRPHGHKVV